MTKTPEELTADWKKGLLESGLYYVGNDKVKDFAFVKPHEISVYTLDSNIPMLLKDNAEILSLVPTYDEYKAMQDHIVYLTQKVERLKKELESSHWYQTIQNEDISNLRDLLRECWAHLSVGKVGTSITPINILLNQISTALNETRANPTDCNKMQESEE